MNSPQRKKTKVEETKSGVIGREKRSQKALKAFHNGTKEESMKNSIRIQTVSMIAKLLHPLAENGVLSLPEEREIIAQLRNLAKTGETIPEVLPKLIGQPEAAEMLGLSLANFKKLERSDSFPFRRKMIGTSVRYRNTDIVKFVLSEDSLESAESKTKE